MIRRERGVQKIIGLSTSDSDLRSDTRPKGVRKLADLYEQELSDQEIANNAHRDIIGSANARWDGAGGFQLHLLQEMGLTKTSQLLDVGCGPGRASEHLIDFLNADSYAGLDSNASYIRACQLMVEDRGLSEKRPDFEVSKTFQVANGARQYDFIMAFSVVQYCSPELRKAFFRNIPALLKEHGKLFISHASWFNAEDYAQYGIAVRQKIESDRFDLSQFGWRDRESGEGVFPILEIGKTP